MYFDFEDNRPDITPIGYALSWRERILATAIFYLLLVLVALVIPPFDSDLVIAQRVARQMELQRQRERDSTRFVFVQPRLDLPATRPLSPKAEASDKDRNAQTRERAENPTNSLPFSRGNTPERVEALRSAPPPPQPAVPSPQESPASTQSSAEAGSPPPALSLGSLWLPGPRAGDGKVPDAPAATGAGAGRGLLGSAMRDLRQMVQQDAFDNPGGGGVFGPSIQFDTKGVEFGPWIRRFVAQIKRNWLIPLAAMALKGHVVITFYVLKDGTITALAVPGPCNVDAFNRSAYNALAASNPTYPLPPEYPSDRAFFTVTFYYNETPPGGPY